MGDIYLKGKLYLSRKQSGYGSSHSLTVNHQLTILLHIDLDGFDLAAFAGCACDLLIAAPARPALALHKDTIAVSVKQAKNIVKAVLTSIAGLDVFHKHFINFFRPMFAHIDYGSIFHGYNSFKNIFYMPQINYIALMHPYKIIFF